MITKHGKNLVIGDWIRFLGKNYPIHKLELHPVQENARIANCDTEFKDWKITIFDSDLFKQNVDTSWEIHN